MSNVQRSSIYSTSPDPVSLDGLEDILEGAVDQLFEPETVAESARTLPQEPEQECEIIDFRPPDSEAKDIVSGHRGGLFDRTEAGGDSRPSLFEGDDSNELRNATLQVKLLEAQLDFRNRELRNSLNRVKWLESQVAIKDDQLKFLPELLTRSAVATQYELEVGELKDLIKQVTTDLNDANMQLNLVRAHWLGKISMWLLEK